MTGGQKVKLTLNGSNKVIHGILKYSNDDLFIVQDDWTDKEDVYPSRCYKLEKLEDKDE